MFPKNKRDLGQLYEQSAADYLIRRGLRLIEKNFSCKCGELDLIMQDRQTLVFVEVKYRKTPHHGHAAEMVTPSKARKVVKTAYFWMMCKGFSPYTTDFRFDVVAIHDQGNDINWYTNAITQD